LKKIIEVEKQKVETAVAYGFYILGLYMVFGQWGGEAKRKMVVSGAETQHVMSQDWLNHFYSQVCSRWHYFVDPIHSARYTIFFKIDS
jgi:hypothetical protein